MIEKTEGCNHMTCKCGAHICWKCINVFKTPQETYNHLRAAYGGIYEEAPAGVAVEDVWNEDFLAGQVEALARIERAPVAREQAAAANPFVGQKQNANYGAQFLFEQVSCAPAEQVRHARADAYGQGLPPRLAVPARQIIAEEARR